MALTFILINCFLFVEVASVFYIAIIIHLVESFLICILILIFMVYF